MDPRIHLENPIGKTKNRALGLLIVECLNEIIN